MVAANSINLSTAGITGFTGTAFVGTPVTQYNILTGAATSSALNNVAPSATSGVALISQGAASQPIFGTVVVAGGGTGQVTLTNHGVLIGQGTSGVVALAAGSAGQIIRSGGAGADPAYSTATYPATAGTSGKVLISDGTNIVSSTPTYPNASVTAGKVIISDGTNYIASTPTFPNASATSGKFIRSDGTNWIASTPTLPTTAGAAGKILISDATNYVESTPTYPSTSGTSGKILISDGTNNVYSTPTYPNTASTALKHIKSDGTNFVTTTVTYPDASVTAGKVIISDGTNYIASTPTFPNASATSGKFIRSDGTNWIASTPTLPTSAGTSGKILQSDATNYVESTATYPSTATGTGTILRADGTNWVATTSTYPNTNAVSTLLYASASNVMGALATANVAILNTNSSGVPSLTASPTIGASNAATLVTIASNSTTAFAIDNGVAHGTTPLIDLYHDAATVANDFSYEIDFNAQNSTPAKKTFGSLQSKVLVNTAASEMGQLILNTINAGSSQVNITVGNNIGQYRGTQTNTAPPAGYIGEQLSAAATSVSLTNNTAKTITSVALTAGNWDVYVHAIASFTNAGTTWGLDLGVSSTTNTLQGNFGEQKQALEGITVAATGSLGLSVSAFRVSLSATTTYYCVATAFFTAGTCSSSGSIRATRVG